MKIRAVTLGMDLPRPGVPRSAFTAAAALLADATNRFAAAGLTVQSTRIAGPALDGDLDAADTASFGVWAADLEAAAREADIGYLSLGRIPGLNHGAVERLVSPVLAAGTITFLSADLLANGQASVPMALACARAVRSLAAATPLGFGNLRFAATASCPPNIPFLPAAYHAGGPPRFAIAVEAADVVRTALAGAGSPAALEDAVVSALQREAGAVERIAEDLAAVHGYPFVGIDLSPAPFPTEAASIGGAIEAVGVDRFGAPGTLYAATIVTRALRRTRLRRSGFSGLMLPLLEDAVLARRAAERPLDLHALLLYSAVCGTGLDTVPLPGDVSEAALAGIYLDIAALSVALGGKPLTARLLPVPGAVAGDATAYEFEYFANSRVLPVSGDATGILARHAGG